ncbi:MAG: DUF1553 domain-containing protein [Pirellulales bacterium]
MRSIVAISCLLAATVFAAIFVFSPVVRGEQPTAEQVEFFEKRVRPILVERCQECHGEDAQESDFRVDSLAALLRGGTRGPSILPGDPKNSLFIRAVGHGETLQMPPKKKLAANQIADLMEWVKQGAPWPMQDLAPLAKGGAANGKSPQMTFNDAQRGHWSFQPLQPQTPPMVRRSEWVQSPLDAFVLKGLEQAQLSPAPAAAPAAWLRRTAFNLTGLPPRVDELQTFLADDAPDARARVVDKYLASPRYGERFGRHWLDLARYADSNGLDENLAYANAFRYRDYVIASLNRDKPYDRFVQEQIAGDLLPHDGDESEREGIVATGFLSLGAKMLAEDDPVKMQMDIIDEQIDTLGKSLLGMTLGCARCHDHKYDPIDLHDYYALAGIFKSTKTMVNHNVVAVWQERPIADKQTVARRDALKQQAEAKRSEATSLATAAAKAWLEAQRPRAGEYLLAAQRKLDVEAILANAEPYGDMSAAEREKLAGLKVLEAEQYDRGNVTKDTTTYGAGIGVLVNRGETPNFAEYDIEVERAGAYRLELRYAAEASRPCQVFVNGRLAVEGAAGKVTGSWQPEGQKWFIEGVVRLSAGKNTVRLEQPVFFPHIDKLLLAFEKDDSLDPAAIDSSSATAAPLDAALIDQWTQFLEATVDKMDSPLAVWRAAVARREASSLTGEMAKQVAERVGFVGLRRADGSYDLRELAERLGRDEALKPALHGAKGPFAQPKNVEALLSEDVRRQLTALRDAAAAIEKQMPEIPEAMAVSDVKPENVRIHFRGSHLTQGEEIARRFLRVLPGGESATIGEGTSGRLELARWLTRPDQPLAPRVIANRLWLWNFGQALVRSPDNFGLLGESPTHPELLDWMARELIRREWSWKSLQREMALSATYAMSDQWDERAGAVDPENRRMWRMPRRRLSAEEIRDAILAASAGLDFKMGGTNLPIKNRQYVTSTANVNPAIYDLRCRSVYVPVVRSALYEVFQAFDFADPSVAAGQREATTVAPQALFMLNSQITATASRELAVQLLREPAVDDAARVTLLYERTVSRSPKEDEVERGLAFVDRYLTAVRGQTESEGEARELAWRALARAVLSANEFVYLD